MGENKLKVDKLKVDEQKETERERGDGRGRYGVSIDSESARRHSDADLSDPGVCVRITT